MKKGEGHVSELIVEVDDLEKFYDDMKVEGVQMQNIDGTPLDDDKKYHILEPYGDKLAYLPTDVSRGDNNRGISARPTGDQFNPPTR